MEKFEYKFCRRKKVKEEINYILINKWAIDKPYFINHRHVRGCNSTQILFLVDQFASALLKIGIPTAILSTNASRAGYVNEEGKILADKISEHLPEDQQHAATLGVPLKILAHPNDAIGKVYGVEHSGRVRGIGGNVCPSVAFGMPRHSINHANVGSSSYMSHQRVEELEKHVEILKEKLTGYEETQEKFEETKKRLAQNENHLATLHRFLQAKFGSEFPTFNLDSA